MRRVLMAALAALVLFAAPAAGKGWTTIHWHWHPPQRHSISSATPAACPFDGPEKMYTIVNAGVTGVTLPQIAAVEQATRDESFALRMYYGTPCARFGAGGKPIYLSNGPSHYDPATGDTSYTISGVHYPNAIYVGTGFSDDTVWARPFTHEIMEDLVDPNDSTYIGNYFAEVCDPVQNLTYPVDGLPVADFVTPSYFTHGPPPWDAGHYLAGPA